LYTLGTPFAGPLTKAAVFYPAIAHHQVNPTSHHNGCTFLKNYSSITRLLEKNSLLQATTKPGLILGQATARGGIAEGVRQLSDEFCQMACGRRRRSLSPWIMEPRSRHQGFSIPQNYCWYPRKSLQQ
jgi:hypothetical protein